MQTKALESDKGLNKELLDADTSHGIHENVQHPMLTQSQLQYGVELDVGKVVIWKISDE